MELEDSAYLMHEYDPVKAREYYLRTRELKGRRVARSAPTPAGRVAGRQVAKAVKGATVLPKPAKPSSKNMTEVRIAALKKRLAELKVLLDKLRDDAKRRSGVEVPTDKKDQKKAEKGPADSKDKSAVQKAKEAKAAKERYEKANPEAALQAEIKAVEAKIAAAREKLKEAIAKAREKAAQPQKPTAPAKFSQTKPQRRPD
jgi:uncharacterized protein YceH (UPF0502 family)